MNTIGFTPEEIKKGLLQDFLNYAINYNNKSDEYYMEVHLWSDGHCQCVDFDIISYDFDSSCRFVYLDEDHVIMRVVNLPDNSTVYASSEFEAEKILTEWLQEHPNWKKNEFGVYREVIKDGD